LTKCTDAGTRGCVECAAKECSRCAARCVRKKSGDALKRPRSCLVVNCVKKEIQSLLGVQMSDGIVCQTEGSIINTENTLGVLKAVTV